LQTLHEDEAKGWESNTWVVTRTINEKQSALKTPTKGFKKGEAEGRFHRTKRFTKVRKKEKGRQQWPEEKEEGE